MGEVIHAAALAPAGLATCCLLADRSRRRGGELSASFVMLVAMADVLWTRMLPIVLWVVILLACGMLLAAHSRWQVGTGRSRRSPSMHTAMASVVMAAGSTLMIGGAMDDAGAAGVEGHHGGSPVMLTAVVLVASAAFAVSSFTAARRGRWQQRAERVGMGVAALTMSALALV